MWDLKSSPRRDLSTLTTQWRALCWSPTGKSCKSGHLQTSDSDSTKRAMFYKLSQTWGEQWGSHHKASIFFEAVCRHQRNGRNAVRQLMMFSRADRSIRKVSAVTETEGEQWETHQNNGEMATCWFMQSFASHKSRIGQSQIGQGSHSINYILFFFFFF